LNYIKEDISSLHPKINSCFFYTQMNKQQQTNQTKNSSNTSRPVSPRYPQPNAQPNVQPNVQQIGPHRPDPPPVRRIEVIRSLQERVPGLQVPNFNDDVNEETVLPTPNIVNRRNAPNAPPIDPNEGLSIIFAYGQSNNNLIT